MRSEPRRLSVWRESFVPVLLLLLCLFLALVYSRFMTVYESRKVSIIEIDPAPVTVETSPLAEEDEIQSEIRLESSDNPLYQEAKRLMAEGSWVDAEEHYRQILATDSSSQAFNDAGVFYYRKGDQKTAIDFLNRSINTVPVFEAAYFNRGVVEAAQQNFIDALRDYETFIAKRPNHFAARFNQGLILLKLGRIDSAAKSLLQASQLAAGERKAKALYSLGICYRRMEPPLIEEARNSFNQAIRLKPDYIDPRFALGALEPDTVEGRAEALKNYLTILKLKPNYSKAHYNIALIYATVGKFREAKNSYKAAIQFAPEYFKARYNLGLLMMEQRDWQEALLQFNWLAQRHPDHPESIFNLGRIAYKLKNYDEAHALYDKAIELKQGNYPEAYLNVGLLHAAKGEHKQAIETYQTAIRLRDVYPEAWYNMGLSALKSDDFELAELAFMKATEQDKRYHKAWFNLGVLFSKTGQIEKAIMAYKKAIEINPGYIQAKINLAIIYADEDSGLDKAIRLYQEIVDQDETYEKAWFNLGLVFWKSGQIQDSETAFRKAFALEENAKTARYIGKTLGRAGKLDSAIEMYGKAIDMDSGDWILRLELGKLLAKTGHAEEALVELNRGLALKPNSKSLKREIGRLKNR